jgi:hypothetical protein
MWRPGPHAKSRENAAQGASLRKVTDKRQNAEKSKRQNPSISWRSSSAPMGFRAMSGPKSKVTIGEKSSWRRWQLLWRARVGAMRFSSGFLEK